MAHISNQSLYQYSSKLYIDSLSHAIIWGMKYSWIVKVIDAGLKFVSN